MSSNRFKWEVRPEAKQENTVIYRNFRFTVLTDRLIRIEYQSEKKFTDAATQVVFYRDFPKTDFTVSMEQDVCMIETSALVLGCRSDADENNGGLSVRLKGEPAAGWIWGEAPAETLGGTAKTLDAVDDTVPLGDGVCSMFGYTVLDDSGSMLLDQDGWIKERPERQTDLYFFGYGYDYRACLKAYYRLTGVPPMLPAYTLGNWWSRYYKYTQQEYLDLMDKFREEDLPFSVAVIDMDWHTVKIPEELKDPDPRHSNGWTGFSWNRELFPDYKSFLKSLHGKNLKTSLNLHPASGVCQHEDQYAEMAQAMGIDPASKQRVPFDILSKKFMESYFDILLHPYEDNGVDFWWMDWQQGTDYWWIHEPNTNGNLKDPREAVDPLWMLNHLHILDICRNGKRPMFFSRFSGPGAHRYPIGFSGDTYITWEALKLQPYFTSTASNIGYCWWSHDIGGHMRGCDEPELLTRWIQLGVFSPINRLHSSSNEFLHKEPWCFEVEYRSVMENYLRLRHSLFPYLYTMNYRCHTELEPLVQPMYYSYPKCREAYSSPQQYMFGTELMVCAVSEKRDANTRLSESSVWFPKGDWYDFFTGLPYHFDKAERRKVYRPISAYPVFARAGAIVPLAEHIPHDNRLLNSEEMSLLVFPGASNRFELYEDAGDGYDYENGGYCKTEITFNWNDASSSLVIEPARGDTSLIPEKRKWKIGFRAFSASARAAVSINENITDFKTYFEAEENTLYVVVSANVTDKIEVTLSAEQSIAEKSINRIGLCKKILSDAAVSSSEKARILSILEKNQTVKDVLWQLYCIEHFNGPLIYALREILMLK